MSDTKRLNKEILSAWVDGDVSEVNHPQSLQQGSESMAMWARYHLIGQVMRREVQHMELDISAQVSQAVAEEDAHQVVAADLDTDSLDVEKPAANVIPFPARTWKQAGGVAIAASVAMVALFGVSTTEPGVRTIQANNLAMTQQQNEATGSMLRIASDVERQELQTMHEMFLKHEALTRKITGMSGLPTVRVVSNQKVIPVQVPMRVKEESRLDDSEKDSVTE